MLDVTFLTLVVFLSNVALEWLFTRLPRPDWNRGAAWAAFVAAVGGMLGLGSLQIFPRPIVPVLAVRVAFLAAAPVLIATILSGYTQSRLARGGRPGFLSSWTEAYSFAAAFWLVRFVATYGA